MKRIIFVLNNYHAMGGIERSLDSLVNKLDKNKWDITILSLSDNDNTKRELPKGIKIKYLSWYKNYKKDITSSFTNLLFNKLIQNFFRAIGLIIVKFVSIIIKNRNIVNRYLLKQYDSLDENYDIAVVYEYPPNHILYIVKDKIKSIKKCVWIHFELSDNAFKEEKNIRLQNLSDLDKIYAVSEDAAKYIRINYPEIQDKTERFYNIIDTSILKKGEEPFNLDLNSESIKIVTIARLSKQKGIDIAIEIAKDLKNENINFQWFVVGGGEEENNLKKLISNYGLNKNFILLGNQNNPYPILNMCDIYVQPSRSEGYCITLAEARVFCKPIVSTDFFGAKEQITNNKTGLIVKFSKEDIKEAIKLLINNEDLKQSFIENLRKENPLNNDDLFKLEQL